MTGSPTRAAPRRAALGRRAARWSRRLAAAAALVTLLAGAPLAAASATVHVDGRITTDVQVTTDAPVDYTSGPYADRLCPTTPAAGVACGVGRTVLAAEQGAAQRERAVAAGATCEVQSGLWVCFEVRSLLVQRGGTTYGDTFLTPDARRDLAPALLAHEAEHVRQWRLFGPDFSLLYLREGVDACGNYFEQQAGLEPGGYDCP
ncbi:hypothetical protein Sked_28400 [Sanguibacter keddieii DSM 10542]|uniref:DUF4157 domain-containing protein n=1 Tax=Sanguibacter keddieii (strain ATCC 51767 / DSM 10542 / NCFB 3025 / ST-74) TaxID=446469 RepID=D1BB41_SANKS|nr:hypothetical protein [Sanguibacter keddieii]ACZ22742.1 hypothetical protein Sked_28400 [Sanguibacter keddieii DSM 10542]